ncbi:pilus assembly FimT family protein [Aphanothece sacrum]|uniref:Prepilin-type N-terminal cleavage/methylation domain-containing protein n=1 Tax=Aphanothece sacrum FPU1 TaxID=1920663 RepID=A0A401ICF0_APHSA|nr:hypothetical protein [Aphanothece sacrum]GBF78947.1 prepilin-type N-terminal cleavage/methylation domain-containing protein [Aphanothece sacrum FPU1]GBF86705.1 prepilin-type N-terminal cleavage/methylation protein [Aphanothece sacrum FPU3]
MLKIYLQLLQKKRRSAGWTLAELMIAAALTLVVVGAAGFGLVTILRENKMANATGEMQYDSNRAGAFISEEIRNASMIENDNIMTSTGAIDKTGLDTIAPSFKYQTGDSRQPILVLKIPGIAERVIYYIETSASPWRGPLVIRRWGPGLLSTGTYSSNKEPGDWKGNVLIDMVAQTVDSNKKKCKNSVLKTSDTKSTDATKNWYRIPQSDADVKGFFICVRDDGQLAEVHTQATTSNQQQMDKMASKIEQSRYRSKFNYDVVTQVFARSRADGAVGLKFPDYSLLPGGLYPNEKGNLKITILSTNLPCQPGVSGKEDVKVTSVQTMDLGNSPTAYKDGGTTALPMIPTTIVKFTVSEDNTSGCDPTGYLEITTGDINKTQREIVYGTNGESLSSIIKDTTALATAKTILQGKGLLDSTGNNLKLADNQVVYFAELSKQVISPEIVNGKVTQVITQETDPVLDDTIFLVELLP